MSIALLDTVANLNPLTTTEMHAWDDGGAGVASGAPLPGMTVPSYDIPVGGWIARNNVVSVYQIAPAGMTFEVVFRWGGGDKTVILGNRRSAWSDGAAYVGVRYRNGQPRLLFYFIDSGASAGVWLEDGEDARQNLHDSWLYPDFPPIEEGKVYHLVVECSLPPTLADGGVLRITLNGVTRTHQIRETFYEVSDMPHWDAGFFHNHIWEPVDSAMEIGFIAIYDNLIGHEEAQLHWLLLTAGTVVIGSRTNILHRNHPGQRARVIVCDAASNRVLHTVTTDPQGEWEAPLSIGQEYYLIHDAAHCAPVAHGVYTAPISEDV